MGTKLTFIHDSHVFWGVTELQILPQPGCSGRLVTRVNPMNRRLSASCHVVDSVTAVMSHSLKIVLAFL